MRTLKIIDGCVRIAAALTAIASLPVVLLVGIMANDAGTPAGERVSQIILLSGTALAIWVFLSCLKPRLFAGRFRGSDALNFLLVTTPRYAFALAGLGWCLMYAYGRLRILAQPKSEVRLSDVAYPQTNQHPVHSLQISGSLPPTLPVSTAIAVYATDAVIDKIPAGPCGRSHTLGPKAFWYTSALTREVTLPISVVSGRYNATVYLDRYLPGRCNWHLRQVYLPLDFKDTHIPKRNAAEIDVCDELHHAVCQADRQVIESGRDRVWCGKGLNRAVTPYFPVICSDFSTFLPRVPPDVQARIPEGLKQSQNPMFISAGAVAVELDFYDIDQAVTDPGLFAASGALKGLGGVLAQSGGTGSSLDHSRRNALALDCEKRATLRLAPFWRSRPDEGRREAKVRELMHNCLAAQGLADSDATRMSGGRSSN